MPQRKASGCFIVGGTPCLGRFCVLVGWRRGCWVAAHGYPVPRYAPYREGDVVGCCMDQTANPPVLRFFKNGRCCIPPDPHSPGVTVGTSCVVLMWTGKAHIHCSARARLLFGASSLSLHRWQRTLTRDHEFYRAFQGMSPKQCRCSEQHCSRRQLYIHSSRWMAMHRTV
mgnify:CR=1 FL=1